MKRCFLMLFAFLIATNQVNCAQQETNDVLHRATQDSRESLDTILKLYAKDRTKLSALMRSHDHYGHTPLHTAVEYRKRDSLQLLLETIRWLKIDYKELKNLEGLTVLEYVLFHALEEELQLLITMLPNTDEISVALRNYHDQKLKEKVQRWIDERCAMERGQSTTPPPLMPRGSTLQRGTSLSSADMNMSASPSSAPSSASGSPLSEAKPPLFPRAGTLLRNNSGSPLANSMAASPASVAASAASSASATPGLPPHMYNRQLSDTARSPMTTPPLPERGPSMRKFASEALPAVHSTVAHQDNDRQEALRKQGSTTARSGYEVFTPTRTQNPNDGIYDNVEESMAALAVARPSGTTSGYIIGQPVSEESAYLVERQQPAIPARRGQMRNSRAAHTGGYTQLDGSQKTYLEH